jgi:quinoprotein glucose dehydrogenase
LDWVQGWDKTGKGRLFRIFEETSAKDQLVEQTRQLLAEGMTRRTPDELGNLLAHADMRVRQEAQFELASRGVDGTNVLAQVALNSPHDLARLHGVWGLGQFARTNPLSYSLLFPLLEDSSNAEVRAQAAKVLAESRFPLVFPYLARAAIDPNSRVRYYGVLGLGRLGGTDAVEPVIQALRDNNDADPFLRHAGVMALTWLDDPSALEAAARDSAPAVRLAALLAMRRLQKPEIAMFLYESRPQLVLEAARAIYDLPINGGMTQLASLINKPAIPKAAMRRALHANFRLGRLEHAMALSDFAGNSNFVAELRADAIDLLAKWAEPTKRDLFVGLWRPVEERDSRAAALTFRSEVPSLLKGGPAEVRRAAISAAVKLDVDTAAPALAEIFKNKAEATELRVESLRALATFKHPTLGPLLKAAADDPDSEVRKAASSLQAKLAPGDALSVVLRMLEVGDLSEKQSALETLGGMDNRTVDSVLMMWLDRVTSGKAPRELQMEILEAAGKRSDPRIKSHLEKYNATRSRDTLANNTEALAGGDAELGKTIFFERQDVQCLRCHQLNGTGGVVGPDLTGVGKRLSREELLESMLLPNNRISKGFENLVIKMQDGSTHVGLLKKEDAENIYIESPEDGALKVPKAEVADLNLGLSSMPPEIATALSKRDLRNLVEFLASQK